MFAIGCSFARVGATLRQSISHIRESDCDSFALSTALLGYADQCLLQGDIRQGGMKVFLENLQIHRIEEIDDNQKVQTLFTDKFWS